MDKLIMLSVIFAMVLIPTYSARMSSPKRGLIVALLGMALFLVFYVIAVLHFAIRFINTTPPPGVYW